MSTVRLLILEDDPYDAELEIAALGEAGYVCQWERVETQAEFLARLNAPDYDLILADYSLPTFDGLTALKLFLERDLDLPFVLVSGVLGEETAIESLKAGATDYVLKGRLSRLGPVVGRALREKEEQRQRKRAEEALEQRITQLALLNEIGEKIAAVLELDNVLDRAARLVQESFGYHHVALFALDGGRGELAMRAGAGSFIDHYPPDHRIELGQGMVGWVGRHGEGLLANDVKAEPRYVNFYPGVIPTRSELSVPVRVKGEVVGVLDVQSPQLNAFDENDVMVMETVADQIAVAIENAHLHEQVQRHAAVLEQCVVERTAELREQQVYTQAILDAAGEGVIVTDLDGAILYMNVAAQQLTGYSLAEASLGTPRLWKSDKHSPEFYGQMWETVLAGRVWRGEMVNKRKDGTLYDAAMTVAPMPGGDGQPTGFVGIQKDITRLKELDRLKDEFVSNVSHELRTPLANLKLYLGLLQRSKPDQQSRYLAILQRETARLGQLIEDLLDISRLDQVGEVGMEPVNLEALAADVLTNHLPQGEACQIKLAFDAQPGLPPARANAALIVQVLTNLLGNALAYTPAGGHVTVHLSQGEREGWSCLIMAVTDDGPGIAPEDLSRIFDRFYRGAVGRESGPGTGLGLSISKKIAGLHGGTVEVESQVGEGSTFRVWLPLEQGGR